MDSNTQAQIFFAVSSFGFIVLGLLAATLIVLGIRALSSLTRILEKIETNVENIGDATKDLIDDLRHNVIFKMFFGQKKVKKLKK